MSNPAWTVATLSSATALTSARTSTRNFAGAVPSLKPSGARCGGRRRVCELWGQAGGWRVEEKGREEDDRMQGGREDAKARGMRRRGKQTAKTVKSMMPAAMHLPMMQESHLSHFGISILISYKKEERQEAGNKERGDEYLRQAGGVQAWAHGVMCV